MRSSPVALVLDLRVVTRLETGQDGDTGDETVLVSCCNALRLCDGVSEGGSFELGDLLAALRYPFYSSHDIAL